jgi:neutral ceramidase
LASRANASSSPATHTHGGPGAQAQQLLSAALVGDNYDPRVVGRIVDGLVGAVTEAVQRLAPASAAVGQTHITGVQENRSLPAHLANPCPDPAAVDDGTACHDHGGAPHSHGPTTHQHGSKSAHAVDPLATMLRVDRADGLPVGVWTSFANHGTVFGPELLFTGDNQGVAARLVERGMLERAAERDVRVPDGWDVVAAYANGAEGDINPDCTGFNAFTCNEQNGRRQAEAFLALYDELGGGLDTTLALDARLDVLYMDGSGGTSPVPILGGGVCAPVDVPGHGPKCPLAVLSGTGVQWFWLQAMRLGDTLLLNVPGEVTVQMGRRMRQAVLSSPANTGPNGTRPADSAVVVGLANDYLAYLTTPEEYDRQMYEGTFTLFGTQQGPYVAERMRALTDALLSGAPGPPYVEPPDTSVRTENVSPATQAASVGREQPGTVLAEPRPRVERGHVVELSWVVGQPSAEVVPGEVFVATQRRGGRPEGVGGGRRQSTGRPEPGWRTVFTDESFDGITTYDGSGQVDRWSTRWDVPLDAEEGAYRFVVTGQAYVDGALTPYTVTSREFSVTPSSGLRVTQVQVRENVVVVRSAYPPADPAVHFRERAAAPTSGSATVEVVRPDGSVVTAIGSYDEGLRGFVVPVAQGRSVRVPAGGLVDGWGNSNAVGWTSSG